LRKYGIEVGDLDGSTFGGQELRRAVEDLLRDIVTAVSAGQSDASSAGSSGIAEISNVSNTAGHSTATSIATNTTSTGSTLTGNPLPEHYHHHGESPICFGLPDLGAKQKQNIVSRKLNPKAYDKYHKILMHSYMKYQQDKGERWIRNPSNPEPWKGVVLENRKERTDSEY